jgi:hypothetical protein
MTMADNTGSTTPDPSTPDSTVVNANVPAEKPADTRPRPQYGELAPEGWTWQPPASATPPAPGVTPVAGAVPPVLAPGAVLPPYVQVAPAPAGAPRWDRIVTIVLLVLGFLGTINTVIAMTGLAEGIQSVYTQLDLGTYTPSDSLTMFGAVGSVLAIAIYLATTSVSYRLLKLRKRSFYVPLIGAALSSIMVFVLLMVLLMNDPTLVGFAGNQ